MEQVKSVLAGIYTYLKHIHISSLPRALRPLDPTTQVGSYWKFQLVIVWQRPVTRQRRPVTRQRSAGPFSGRRWKEIHRESTNVSKYHLLTAIISHNSFFRSGPPCRHTVRYIIHLLYTAHDLHFFSSRIHACIPNPSL